MPTSANPFQANAPRKMTELMSLLRLLDPKEAELFAEGESEVKEMLEDLGINS